MQVTVRKRGNGASVQIPASVMAAADIQIGQAVEMTEEGGCIVLRPLRAYDFTLEQLLDGMTPETFHHAVDFGTPLGKEVW